MTRDDGSIIPTFPPNWEVFSKEQREAWTKMSEEECAAWLSLDEEEQLYWLGWEPPRLSEDQAKAFVGLIMDQSVLSDEVKIIPMMGEQ